MTFEFKNGYLNEVMDSKEISCSWSRNTVSHKIDFKAVWLRNGHTARMGVKKYLNKFKALILNKWGCLKSFRLAIKKLVFRRISALLEHITHYGESTNF